MKSERQVGARSVSSDTSLKVRFQVKLYSGQFCRTFQLQSLVQKRLKLHLLYPAAESEDWGFPEQEAQLELCLTIAINQSLII